ncbi:MAG: hypothetical protein KJN85_09575, partial [Maribacter sp.]|nr:hypothetical protein [Maribacter sp.]
MKKQFRNSKKGIWVFMICHLILGSSLNAQENHLAGFKQKISGTDFTYHSPFSYKEKCLLTRARA